MSAEQTPSSATQPSSTSTAAMTRPTMATAGASAPSGPASAPSAATNTPPPPGTMPASGLDAGQPDEPLVEPEQLCDRMTDIQCEAESRCCDTARAVDACKSARMMGCMGMNLAEIARSPVSGFKQAKTSALLGALRKLGSSCDPSVKPWTLSPNGLRSLFEGTVAADAECLPAAGLDPVTSFGAALASCKDPATRACAFSGEAAPPIAPTTATCAARAGVGAKCFVETNCLEELYCDNTAMTYSGGTCAMRKELGATCVRSFECKSGFCDHTGDTCGPPDVQRAYCE
jgi:hypothetical protein